MIDKKVVVVATGGTIAMKYDKEKHGLVPACSGKDLADAVPGLGDIAPLEFVQFSNIASPGMTPQNMWDLHCKIEELLARDDPELRVTCSTFRIAAVVQKAGAIQNSADARQEYCS